MQMLSPDFVGRCPHSIINVHHSFLPAFSARGRTTALQARSETDRRHQPLRHGNLDEGPIIEQDVVRIPHRDGLADLQEKGRDLEKDGAVAGGGAGTSNIASSFTEPKPSSSTEAGWPAIA